MTNDHFDQCGNDELERNAFNAAFCELGFRWHWDRETYSNLVVQGRNAADRIGLYLRTRQAHLLKAYDAAFLVELIQDKARLHKQRIAASGATAPGQFDWAEAIGCELGA